MIQRKEAPVCCVTLLGQKIPLLDCVKRYSEEQKAGNDSGDLSFRLERVSLESGDHCVETGLAGAKSNAFH